MSTVVHCSIEKSYLLREISLHGLRAVLVVPEGVTDGDMIAVIERSPRSYFVMGPCDHRLPDGSCGGHDAPDTEECRDA